MNIFLSIPILGKPELKHLYSVYQSILTCRDHNVRLYFNENDSLISRVRNVHISKFLNEYTDCDYFMSLDSDIEVVNCFPTNNIFTKLISHNLDFVGGLYAIKKPGPRRCSSISEDGNLPEYNSGLAEMRWLSTGCWCLKRSVVQKMADSYPELIYDGDDNATGQKIYGLYIPIIYDMKKEDFPEGVPPQIPFRKYLSEDWSFCDRWKRIGGKIYADTSIVLKHIGKHDYMVWGDVQIVQKQRIIPPTPGFDLDPNVMEELKNG